MMSRAGPYAPDRGDIVWVDFDPIIGHEQNGHRPALVLSGTRYNARTGLFLVCPITSQAKGYDHEVPLPPGLPVVGVVLCDHIRSLDWNRRGVRHLGQAPASVMTAVTTQVLRAIH